MNNLFRSPEETALTSLGVALEAAATFYEHAREVSHGDLRAFLNERADALAAASKAWNGNLRDRDILPATPDEDAETLRRIALFAGMTLGTDEEAVLFDMCARTEQRLLAALGEAAAVAPEEPFIRAAEEAGHGCVAAIAGIWRLRSE
ncbi:hypothetical protein FHS78_002169 [Parvibaculum indicum]|uniref:hypothetical protein n=1 Tax=Parvibaculum indicum TaxID=562969 RepID=UPI001421FA50|nr:hypothetical protein [Parvibaculum indicum]NIJ41879.1 hypothetical protein [Parvibaculum indicum]